MYGFEMYLENFGAPYYNFHRRDIHSALLAAATDKSKNVNDIPCKIHLNYKATKIDYETGTVIFEKGEFIYADLIIGADVFRSLIKSQLGIERILKKIVLPVYVLYDTKEVKKLRMPDFAANEAIEFWSADEIKIVMSSCLDIETVC